MPGLALRWEPVTLRSVLVPFGGPRSPLRDAASAVTLPASLLPSLLVVGACAIALRRRGRRRAAAAWTLAWLAGNAVEGLSKLVLARPHLYAHAAHGVVHLRGFDQSFPSGHTVRSLLDAAVVAAVVPALRWAAGAWAAASLSLLLVAGLHTPSDILGGVALAALLAGSAAEVSSRESHTSARGQAPMSSQRAGETLGPASSSG